MLEEIKRLQDINKLLVETLEDAYSELLADSYRDGARCLLLTRIEKTLQRKQNDQ